MWNIRLKRPAGTALILPHSPDSLGLFPHFGKIGTITVFGTGAGRSLKDAVLGEVDGSAIVGPNFIVNGPAEFYIVIGVALHHD